MDRRTFLKSTLGALGGATLVSSGLSGCAKVELVRKDTPTMDEILEQRPRVMWVAAHPDDESLAGSVMAKAGLKLGCPLYFLVLTHGDGGECLLPEGCHPDLATVRGEEMKQVAKLYGAQLQHEYFYNAPLPTKSFPARHEIAAKWLAKGDPAVTVAKAIRSFKPTLLLTFAPIHGFTGHPEHQLASRFATAGVRLAADPKAAVPGEPHRVEHIYYGLNRYWITKLIGSSDPLPITEKWDIRQPCVGDRNCVQVMAENTRPHRTQAGDMGAVREISKYLDWMYLHRADPWNDIYDPYEKVNTGGMI